jgi:hypothetical protein
MTAHACSSDVLYISILSLCVFSHIGGKHIWKDSDGLQGQVQVRPLGLQRLQGEQSEHLYIQGVTKRCLPSWLTNSALVYEPKCGAGGGSCGVCLSQ